MLIIDRLLCTTDSFFATYENWFGQHKNYILKPFVLFSYVFFVYVQPLFFTGRLVLLQYMHILDYGGGVMLSMQVCVNSKV